MKKTTLLYFLLTIAGIITAKAQVSHGGHPLPFLETKSITNSIFEDMPSFDVDEEIRIDAMNESDLRSGYRFAYKFVTNINRSNSGQSFTLPDGTRVWRVGIRSKGALSINLLFTEYELPEGAQLFLYNPLQTQVLGSFTSLNNSEKGILPIAPIQDDELIVEYQEPANASFPGRLTIGEVNHGYRSLKGYEPGGDRKEYFCMPSPVCFDDEQYKLAARSVVLITIHGTTACTGVMLNNTSNDGKPYLLTASHCLNKNFSVSNPDYEEVAGTIVSFFNYCSPTCDTVMRGTEEMSVASASCKAVNIKNDMALLELQETPPVYYQPYYSGWNIGDKGNNPPYTGIHHPRASVKRINISDDKIILKSFNIAQADFYKDAHWNVEKWSTGSTASGSSGSPLFDSENRVIGALSGGSSSCYTPVDDYYFTLSKAWEPSVNKHQQLKYWLDPSNSNKASVDGLDPYANNPCLRLSNIFDTKLQDEIEITALTSSENGNMFGTNSLKTTEYLEEYNISKKAKVYGLYIVTPTINDRADLMNVEVVVYSGNGKPQTQVGSVKFNPTYTELSIIDSSFIETEKWLNRSQESFIHFDEPIDVSGSFYIGYKIKSPEKSDFAVYNLPKGKSSKNTAWIKTGNEWVKASNHPITPFNTSLFIDPVIQYSTYVDNEKPIVEQSIQVVINSGKKSIHVLLPEDLQRADFELYSIRGELIYKTILSSSNTIIPLTNLNPGIYVASIKGHKIIYTQKIYFN